ncbi:F-box protein [Tetrabaena socialis]|uniref:F-box protein n=1 Tax=Tetrabaena socialis TaxID=47790 RepID=A0A2J8A694_9CHLO|nr:F-box protein [Tetrabaena socialis]|eukprot:PNH08020.1 F-box protein [Tetrabaena socialis]
MTEAAHPLPSVSRLTYEAGAKRSGLTAEQFRREYEIPNRPVVLQDVMSSWPAMAKWDRRHLEAVFGEQAVIVGEPGSAPGPGGKGEEAKGPKWLILGPERSGSSFHVDPNATSAWNGLIWGAKKWVLYPPGTVPPGVHPSADGADVATPVSLAEWFLNCYAATREGKVRPVELIARPGDLLFVPRGWWHCALNLEESCAITQNFVSEVGLPSVLAFLRSRRPEMVSGCSHENRCNLYDRFVAALRQHRPAVLAAVEAKQEEARGRARETSKLAALFRGPTSPQQGPPHSRPGQEAGPALGGGAQREQQQRPGRGRGARAGRPAEGRGVPAGAEEADFIVDGKPVNLTAGIFPFALCGLKPGASQEALRARFFNRGSLRAATMERMFATCTFNKLLLPEALSAVLPLETLPCSGSRWRSGLAGGTKWAPLGTA